MKTTICHKDGTISYWSIYDQSWKNHAEEIPDRELAAMGESERERVIRHLGITEDHETGCGDCPNHAPDECRGCPLYQADQTEKAYLWEAAY